MASSHPLLFLFLIFSIIPTAFALSDQDIMSHYSNPTALQDAINNGTVNYVDIPPDIQVVVHDRVNQQTTTIWSSGEVFGIGLAVILLIGLPLMLRSRLSSFITQRSKLQIKHGKIKSTKSYQNYRGTLPKGFGEQNKEEEPTIEIHLGHKILLLLGILKVKHKHA